MNNYSKDISLILSIKNNIEYTKNFYFTTRKLYPDIEICFASYDSKDETNEWLDRIILQDCNIKVFHANDNTKSFSDTYNKSVSLSTKPFILFVHNDMILSEKFIENIYKHIQDDTVVSYTTVEPPIFSDHERPGKLIHNCGTDLNNFDSDKWKTYSKIITDKNKDKIEDGITFFMCLSRDLFMNIGGFDNLFYPFFREDDDLIKRLKMVTKKHITSLDSLCYHFVSKTSRFSTEYQHQSSRIEYNNIRNYIRKWGSITEPYSYDVDFLLKNCSLQALFEFEPLAKNIYIEKDKEYIKEKYISMEQKNTKISLINKIHTDPNSIDSDIVCIIDCEKINKQDINNISNIQYIINDINKHGAYEINNIILDIHRLNTTHFSKIKI